MKYYNLLALTLLLTLSTQAFAVSKASEKRGASCTEMCTVNGETIPNGAEDEKAHYNNLCAANKPYSEQPGNLFWCKLQCTEKGGLISRINKRQGMVKSFIEKREIACKEFRAEIYAPKAKEPQAEPRTTPETPAIEALPEPPLKAEVVKPTKAQKNLASKACSMLIVGQLKELNPEQDEEVKVYLKSLDLELKASHKMNCGTLLDKIKSDQGKQGAPMGAFANSLLAEILAQEEEDKRLAELARVEAMRRDSEEALKEKHKELKGCVKSAKKLMTNPPYNLRVNKEAQGNALVSIGSKTYGKLFEEVDNPVLEITSSSGNKVYSRVGDNHNFAENTILVADLLAEQLSIKIGDTFSVNICSSLPQIESVKFKFYGSKEELDKILAPLKDELPSIINTLSYLSLGMLLKAKINDNEVDVRVEELTSKENDKIFVGLIQFGENELPFEIDPDL